MTVFQRRLIYLCCALALLLASLLQEHGSRLESLNFRFGEENKVEEARKLLKKEPNQQEATEQLGLHLWILGRNDEARPLLEQCRDWSLARKKSAYDPDVERTTLRLADFYTDTGDFDRAKWLYEQLRNYDEEKLGPNSAKLGRDHNNIGLSYFLFAHTKVKPDERKRLAEKAMPEYKQAESIFRALNLNAQLTANLENQSATLFFLGRTDEATRLHTMVKNSLVEAHTSTVIR